MNDQIRVRFAPSPTGYLHVGGLRTALYNYLFARRHNGRFVLRIEDTDQARKVEGAVENLIETLRWAGIEYDEGPGREGDVGPYVQSQRLPIYHSHVQQLIDAGTAYSCFCTPERLDEIRQKQMAAKQAVAYDRHCRDLSPADAARRIAAGEKRVVRMKVPLTGEMTFHDIIRGDVTIGYNVLDDQVILKSDGFPTYHLAVVVDDHLMGVTHVIRGEEWLPSVPKHILLYQYFGWSVPQMAHLPLLLNPDRSKLSKRQGDVAVEDYRTKGYLKEAMVNFIAFLGWNPGDEREIFSMQELTEAFTLERVGQSGAVFNVDKLNWLNQQHLKLKPAAEIAAMLRPMLAARGITDVTDEYLQRAIGLMRERVTLLPEFIENGLYLFRDPDEYEDAGVKKSWDAEAVGRITTLADELASLAMFDHPSIEGCVRLLSERWGIKAGKIIHPTRLAVSGRTGGPGLFEMMELLGRDAVVRRLRSAVERIPVR